LILALAVPPSHAAFSSAEYQVGPGDDLYVDFPLRGTTADLQPLGGNGLSLIVLGNKVYFRYTATVSADGYLIIPAIEPIRVAGYPVPKIQEMIAGRLRSLELQGNPSVTLAKANNCAFYVTGAVTHPGRYLYERPTSLIEAIALAGGPTDHAKLSKILLMRNGQAVKINLSYERLEKEGAPNDVMVLPTDNIVVPRQWFIPDNTLIFLIISALGTSVAVYAALK